MPETKLIRLHRKSGLYLKDAGHKGRGVFCTTDIKRDEELEISPALILNEDATRRIDKTILDNYVFMVGGLSAPLKKRKGIKKTDDCSAVIMGVASFCNHDEHPNATIEWEEVDGSVYYTLRATRPIARGQEICTTYGNTWFKDRK